MPTLRTLLSTRPPAARRRPERGRWPRIAAFGLSLCVCTCTGLAATYAMPAAALTPPHLPLDPERLTHRPPSEQEAVPAVELESAAPLAVAAETPATPPGSAELALEDPLVAPTPELEALAERLGKNGRRIFNFVRDNILYTPTFGATQAAEGCRLSRECNAHDTAALLVALLRSAGIPARFVTGSVELEPGFFRSAMGDFADLREAGNFAASAGTPTTFVVSSTGEVVSVRLQHVWVEAFLSPADTGWDLGGGPDPRWVPLDAALKLNRFLPPLDVSAVGGLDADRLLAIFENSTFGPNRDSVTNIDVAAFQAELDNARLNLEAFLATTDRRIGQLTGVVQPNTLPEPAGNLRRFLNGRFPGTVLQAVAMDTLPEDARHGVLVVLADLAGTPLLTFASTLPDLANRRLTIDYLPATPADAAFVEASGGIYAAPFDQFEVRPLLRLDGEIVAFGPPGRMGTFHQLNVGFIEPGRAPDTVTHFLAAGSVGLIGINPQRISSAHLRTRLEALRSTLRDVRAGRLVRMDDVIGEVLHAQTQMYFALLDARIRTNSNAINVAFTRRPAEMLMRLEPVFAPTPTGEPVEQVAMGMDFRRHIVSLGSRVGDDSTEADLLFSIGHISSALEHGIFEIAQHTASVSTIRLQAEANAQGIPLFAIDSTNFDRVLPQLLLPPAILADIQSAVAAGQQVLTPQTPVRFLEWLGIGYTIMDPETGAGGFFISGSIAGGATAVNSPQMENAETLRNTQGYLTITLDPGTGLPAVQAAESASAADTNATSVEGVIRIVESEVEITADEVAVVHRTARRISSEPSCAQQRFATYMANSRYQRIVDQWRGSILGGMPFELVASLYYMEVNQALRYAQACNNEPPPLEEPVSAEDLAEAI